MAKLVIVESPAKAKTIGKYLGDDYEVTASMGHIRDLPASQLGIDVEHGYTPQYISIKGKEKLIKELKSKAKHADGVLLATDPDREGEAISWHLANILGLDPTSPTVSPLTRSPKGCEGGHGPPPRHRRGSVQRPAGAPRAGPSGGLQAQPVSVAQGAPRPVRRPCRAWRCG